MMKLIPDWRKAWRYYSVWAYAVIVALPDLYNALAAFGAFDGIPAGASWTIRIAACMGVVVRLVNQAKPDDP